MLKKLAALAFALGFFATQALPAFACGALVAPNGQYAWRAQPHWWPGTMEWSATCPALVTREIFPIWDGLFHSRQYP